MVVARVAIGEEPLVDGARCDYADRFAVRVPTPDGRSAEEWVRAGLEGAPWALRWLVLNIHRRVLRFRLVPGDRDQTILGWTVVAAEPDVVFLEATGPLMRGVIVGRRIHPTEAELSTFVFYRQPWVRLLWTAVAPVHRSVARYLIKRAAIAARAA